MKTHAYFLAFLFCIIGIPMEAIGMTGGPLTVKKSKSTGIQLECIYPSDDEIEFSFENESTTNEVTINEVGLEYLNGDGGAIVSYIVFDQAGNVVDLPYEISPVSDSNPTPIITVRFFTESPFYDTHHSLGLSTIDLDVNASFLFDGEEQSFTELTYFQPCGAIQTSALKTSSDICDLQNDELLTFGLENQTLNEVNVTEISATLTTEGNEVVEIITLDELGEETVSLPYGLSYNGQVQDAMQIVINLENPIGQGLPENITSMILTYNYEIEDGEFSESVTYDFDFRDCQRVRGKNKKDVQVYPNPITSESIAQFAIDKESAEVSAWIFSKTPGSSTLITLIENETFNQGYHQLDIPVEELVGGAYELILKIDNKTRRAQLMLAID